VIILHSRVLPRWLGVTGLVVSGMYLLNQGDILATAVPGFPVWDLAGLLGSTGWGLWVAALGIVVLRRPVLSAEAPAGEALSGEAPSGAVVSGEALPGEPALQDASDAPSATVPTPRPPAGTGVRS
jgi:hypothetical protein